jgi:hypothetical protein
MADQGGFEPSLPFPTCKPRCVRKLQITSTSGEISGRPELMTQLMRSVLIRLLIDLESPRSDDSEAVRRTLVRTRLPA